MSSTRRTPEHRKSAKNLPGGEAAEAVAGEAAGAVAGGAAEAVAGEAADARPEARKLVLVEYYSCSYLNFHFAPRFW
jgi:hypothetical protein